MTPIPTLTPFFCFLVIPKVVWLWSKGFLSYRKGSPHDAFTKPLPCITKVMSPLVSCPSCKLLVLSHSVLSNSLQPHGLQHNRPPCLSPAPRVYSNSCIESMMSSNYLILCHPLLLPSVFPCIRIFANESVLCIRWPNYWSFSFSISPSNEYSGLTSCRMDWLNLLAVQGTLKSLLQNHTSKALILQLSAFFMV